MKSKKSQVTIYLAGLIVMIIIVTISAFLAPLGARFTSEMVVAGQTELLRANETISKIQNQTIKDRWAGTVGEAYEAAETNIEVTTDMFQYMWVIVCAVVALILFLYTRRVIEVGGGGFI